MDHGADVNVRDGDDGIVLQLASFEEHEEVVEMLLEKVEVDTDTNAQGGEYGTALEDAYMRGDNMNGRIFIRRWVLPKVEVSISASGMIDEAESGAEEAKRIRSERSVIERTFLW